MLSYKEFCKKQELNENLIEFKEELNDLMDEYKSKYETTEAMWASIGDEYTSLATEYLDSFKDFKENAKESSKLSKNDVGDPSDEEYNEMINVWTDIYDNAEEYFEYLTSGKDALDLINKISKLL